MSTILTRRSNPLPHIARWEKEKENLPRIDSSWWAPYILIRATFSTKAGERNQVGVGNTKRNWSFWRKRGRYRSSEEVGQRRYFNAGSHGVLDLLWGHQRREICWWECGQRMLFLYIPCSIRSGRAGHTYTFILTQNQISLTCGGHVICSSPFTPSWGVPARLVCTPTRGFGTLTEEVVEAACELGFVLS